jgi:polyribonucleotide nucleotidyltransferase
LITEIPKEKIGDVIGPGGKIIRKTCEDFGVKVEVSEDEEARIGIVKVLSVDGPSGEEAMAYIRTLVAEPEIGKLYNSKVVRITDFGAFCQFMPGRDGLLHISKISKKGRLNSVTDILNEGDFITLKLTEKDRLGRYSLSAVDVEENDF